MRSDVMASASPVAKSRSLTEAEIQRGLRDLLEHLGFVCFHNRFAIGSDPGFPDVLGVRDDGALVAIEVKGPKGTIRPGQAEWLNRFRTVPGCIFAEIVGPRMGMCWESYEHALEIIQERSEQYRVDRDVLADTVRVWQEVVEMKS